MTWNPFRRAARLLGARASSARPARGPRPRVRLAAEALEDRTTPALTGTFNQFVLSGSTYYAIGTASAPGVTINVWVNDSYQQNGLNAFSLAAVGQADGSGNYAVPVPNAAMINTSAVVHGVDLVQVYGIDPGTGRGALFPTAAGTGQDPNFWTMYYGDATVTSPGGTVQVQTYGQYAGAVSAITAQGFQYLDRHDQGRDEQTAVWGIPASEPAPPPATQGYVQAPAKDLLRFNPTEGGSEDDDAPQNYTHSYLQNISMPSSNEVTTTTQMALWNAAGETIDQHSPNPDNAPPYYSPEQAFNPEDPSNQPGPYQTLSDMYLTKSVTAGFAGLDNVIYQPTSVTVPAADLIQQDAGEVVFQVQQIAFTDGRLNQDWYYDFATQTVSRAAGPLPPNYVFVQSDGTNYIALVSRQRSGANALSPVYSIDSAGNDGGRNYIGVVWQGRTGTYEGTYAFDNYIVVGSLASVQASLRTLQADGYIGSNNTWTPVSAAAPSQLVADPSGHVEVYGVFGNAVWSDTGSNTSLNWQPTNAPVSVTSIAAVAYDGSVYVTTASQGLWRYLNGTWQQVNVAVPSQLVADPSGHVEVYGVFGNAVWSDTASNTSLNWQPTNAPVSVTGIAAVAYDGSVYAATASQGQWRDQNGTWQQVNGTNPSRLLADPSGRVEVYGLFGSTVYAYAPVSWQPVSATLNVTGIGAVASDGSLYAATASQGLWRDVRSSSWQQVNTATPSQLVADPSGQVEVYGLFGNAVWSDTASNTSLNWQPTNAPVSVTSIAAVAYDGSVYVTTASQGLWRYLNGTWQQVNTATPSQLVADPSGHVEVYGLFGNAVWSDTGSNTSLNWQPTSAPVSVTSIAAVAYDGSVYAATASQGLWRDLNGTWQQVNVAVPSQLVADPSGHVEVYGLFGNTVWSDTGSNTSLNWQPTNAPVSATSIAGVAYDGSVYVTTASQGQWRYLNGTWQQVNGTNPAQLVADPPSGQVEVYGVFGGGLYFDTASTAATGWQSADCPVYVGSVVIARDGTRYVISPNQQGVWRF